MTYRARCEGRRRRQAWKRRKAFVPVVWYGNITLRINGVEYANVTSITWDKR